MHNKITMCQLIKYLYVSIGMKKGKCYKHVLGLTEESGNRDNGRDKAFLLVYEN